MVVYNLSAQAANRLDSRDSGPAPDSYRGPPLRVASKVNGKQINHVQHGIYLHV